VAGAGHSSTRTAPASAGAVVCVEARNTIRTRPDVSARAASDTRFMNQITSTDCMLRLAADGTKEPCPRERCAFWEAGGAVLEGKCLIERLGVDVRRPDLATYLLEARECLEEARVLAEAERAHLEFSRRIGLEL
jgi:hypothetical protein